MMSTKSHYEIRWYTAFASLFLVLGVMLASQGCSSQNDEKELLAMELLTLDIEPMKFGGRYKALVVGSKFDKPLYIMKIKDFDHQYKEGYRYRIKVREVTSKKNNQVEYILSEVVWEKEAKES